MPGTWIRPAQQRLRVLRAGQTGWSYRPGCAPGVEPTALAALGLLGSGGSRAEVQSAAAWLASIQQPDGSLGVSTELPAPGWPTPYALLLWAACDGCEAHCRRAAAWLLRQQGKAVTAPTDGVVGHNPALVGWAWVPETHSWLEPTALAVLALARLGLGTHPRVAEGVRLICDRAVPDGGWNYGNRAVFGHALRAQPAPTGLALLALAAAAPGARAQAVAAPACDYLRSTLPETRAPLSLAWGLLGLSAWQPRPECAEGWLAEAAARALPRPDAAPRLGALLLASSAEASRLIAGR